MNLHIGNEHRTSTCCFEIYVSYKKKVHHHDFFIWKLIDQYKIYRLFFSEWTRTTNDIFLIVPFALFAVYSTSGHHHRKKNGALHSEHKKSTSTKIKWPYNLYLLAFSDTFCSLLSCVLFFCIWMVCFMCDRSMLFCCCCSFFIF